MDSAVFTRQGYMWIARIFAARARYRTGLLPAPTVRLESEEAFHPSTLHPSRRQDVVCGCRSDRLPLVGFQRGQHFLKIIPQHAAKFQAWDATGARPVLNRCATDVERTGDLVDVEQQRFQGGDRR